MDALAQGFAMVFSVETLLIIMASSLFGLFVGAVPGLSATMALALLVPMTFFMDPIPALAAMVSCSAMAIFVLSYSRVRVIRPRTRARTVTGCRPSRWARRPRVRPTGACGRWRSTRPRRRR